jgi:hypothetical protein
MGKRPADRAHRAVQQRKQAAMDNMTKGANLIQPTKAELRAMIPPYPESMVKRVEPKVKSKKSRV